MVGIPFFLFVLTTVVCDGVPFFCSSGMGGVKIECYGISNKLIKWVSSRWSKMFQTFDHGVGEIQYVLFSCTIGFDRFDVFGFLDHKTARDPIQEEEKKLIKKKGAHSFG